MVGCLHSCLAFLSCDYNNNNNYYNKRENPESEQMCGAMRILMKNVRYNGNPNEKCAVQLESE